MLSFPIRVRYPITDILDGGSIRAALTQNDQSNRPRLRSLPAKDRIRKTPAPRRSYPLCAATKYAIFLCH